MASESRSRADLAARIAKLDPQQRAQLEKRLLQRGAPASAPGIPRRAKDAETPLSFAQQRLWFLDRLHPGSSLYNVPEVLRLRGNLQIPALGNALNDLVARHEVLRTAFVARDGEAYQDVRDVAPVLDVTDLGETPPERREPEALRLAAEECERPFDLARPPLLRARLLRLSPDEHWLVLVLHHIVSDEWSFGVLFTELSTLYAARVSGHGGDLAPLSIQFGDYAVWQRSWLQGAVEEQQLSFWRRELSGDLPLLALPADRPRPAIATHRGAEHRSRLSGEVVERLQGLSRDEGTTLFMTLLASFHVLLSRESGQDDILIGTPIAGRNQIETEKLIGFFVNTLVLRPRSSGDPSFREFLRRVRETALEAYAHQDLPFERLVEDLRPERSLSHSPLFQVMFSFDEGSGASLTLPGLEVERVELADSTSKFDLSVLVSAGGGEIDVSFEYSTDLFDEATVARFGNHYQRLLEGIVSDPDRPISLLPLLGESERRRVLIEWNRTEAPYPRAKPLHRLFEEQAGRTPDSTALELGGLSLTYRELDRRSNALARRLAARGVVPDSLVGVCAPRSIELVVAFLGVLKAGGAYVPLDPAYPAERLAFMLQDMKAPVLLSTRSIREALPPFAGHTIFVDSDSEAASSEEPLPPSAGPENIAYVIYTSGSTGKPKGVAVPHRAIVNHMSWMQREFPLGTDDAVVQKTPTSFDASVWEFWAPLGSGARLVLGGPEDHHDPASLVRTILDKRVTILQAVPAFLTMLLEEEGFGTCRTLRRVFCGGSALAPELVERFFSRLSSELINLYGPTEATIDATFWRCRADEKPAVIPIGRPISNTRTYVVDRNQEPVPIGVAGELWIGGDGLARGYVDRPEMTAERFRPDPFVGEPDARVYRTGDRARWRSDGRLEFLGRSDDQVKIRGFRIELGEIEATLAAHSRVRQAVVVVREDVPGDRRLIAYAEGAREAAPAVPDLVRHLRERLPEHMVPASLVVLEALPRLPNGKIDRGSLPAPDAARPQLDGAYQSPRDPLELRLVEIFESLLRVHPVGVHDDFFDLGGHSLLAVRLFAEVEKAIDTKLPLATLFRAPTVAQLAQVVRDRGWTSPWLSLVPIQAGGTRPPFFCVHAVGGSVLRYRALARRLGSDQPFYGVQARGLDDGASPLTRVEDMAESYLEEIRSLQPRGPYYLGGHSSGGLVAFEMARRLEAAGEPVGIVALFDTWCPGQERLIPSVLARLIARSLLGRFGRILGGLGRGTVSERLAYVSEKLRIRARVLRGDSDLPESIRQVRAFTQRAAEEYRPGEYTGRVTLFRASEQPREYAIDRTLGWGTFARGGVDIQEVPGEHGDVVEEPQAEMLAIELRACLDRATGSASAASSARG